MSDGPAARTAAPTVCVVGLGLMGRPAARRLAEAGISVRGWNRSPLDPALADGIEQVATLAEAAAADVVLLLLANSVATGELLAALDPHLRRGSVVLNMGTDDPVDSRQRAAALAARGVGWVDAPVSGGPEKTVTGRLAIMAGGNDEDVRRVWPVLEGLGGAVTHVGGPGAGHTMKLVNQVIVAIAVDAVAEALALAEAAGFTVPEVQKALHGGNADNPQLDVMGTRMGARYYEPAAAKVRTMLKDIRIAQRLAAELGLVLPLLDVAAAQYAALADRGDADSDVSMLIELCRPTDRS